MESSRLDVTYAIQSLRTFIYKLGKRVENPGKVNYVFTLIDLGNNMTSIKDTLGNLFGADVTNYTIKELCDKVLIPAIDLSTDWDYMFNYKFIVPNGRKKPNKLKFEVWLPTDEERKIVRGEVVEMLPQENSKGVEKMKEKKNYKGERKAKTTYSKEALDYIKELYSKDEEAAAKYYKDREKKVKVTAEQKEALKSQFIKKYPQYINEGANYIWGAFYGSRIKPYKAKYEFSSLENIKWKCEELKSPITSFEQLEIEEKKDKIKEKKDKINDNKKVNRHTIQDDYKQRVREYISKVGAGEFEFIVADFVKDILQTEAYTKSVQISSFNKVLRRIIVPLNEDVNFNYNCSWALHLFDKDTKYAADGYKVTLTITQTQTVDIMNTISNKQLTVIEQPTDIPTRQLIEECIEKVTPKYKRYSVGYSLNFYAKRFIGKPKYIGTRSFVLELVLDADKTKVQVNKEIRKNIEGVMNSNKPKDKLVVSIEPVNGKDYNILLSKEI